MGKAARFACIFVPMALSIASLICLILVFAGQTNKSMEVANELYFFKVSTAPTLGSLRLQAAHRSKTHL